MQEDLYKNQLPVPGFRFNVNWGTIAQNISFQEVSGLQIDKQVQQHGIIQRLISMVHKAPGLHRPGLVTLKNVIFPSDRVLMALYDQLKQKKISGQPVEINLLDEEGNSVLTWTLKDAWVSNLSFSDLRSDANELANYRVEVVHNGIRLEAANVN